MNAYPTIPVSNMEEARVFYEETLGLEEIGERDDAAVLYRSGNTQVMLYESEYAGTSESTAMVWEADDPEALVGELREKGVIFEHYADLVGAIPEGDMHRMGAVVAAWFKDPDGNILAVGNMV